MRFLRKDKIEKTIIVVSDLHLGAGVLVGNRRNYLEYFYYDKEFVEFLSYYSSGDYAGRDVELIINGDLLDFLAVPFVKFFDDEFWSEHASLDKLKLILEAHPEVIKALIDFLTVKKKKIVYVIGNHDAEMILDSVREYFIQQFPEECRENLVFHIGSSGEYSPHEGVLVKHGHEYEVAHFFNPQKSIVVDEKGVKYFLPPWGSYYVTRVINRFKEERVCIDSVRPVKKFLINGIIYDTLFTLRFIFASVFYFIMVRFIYFFKQSKNIKKIISYALRELELFKDYETLTKDTFIDRKDVKALIVSHTHIPVFRSHGDGTVFINTGTWTRTYNLDFDRRGDSVLLTYAQVDIQKGDSESNDDMEMVLNVWKGNNNFPYTEY